VAKHTPNQQTMAAKHPSEVIPNQHYSYGKASAQNRNQPTTTATKHPPEQHSGKASANRRPT